MRLLVKEVIVGKDVITIKHSIPVQATQAVGNPKTSKSPTQQDTAQSDKSSLLCKGRERDALRRAPRLSHKKL
jgi:site-specific DNA recombinase